MGIRSSILKQGSDTAFRKTFLRASLSEGALPISETQMRETIQKAINDLEIEQLKKEKLDHQRKQNVYDDYKMSLQKQIYEKKEQAKVKKMEEESYALFMKQQI